MNQEINHPPINQQWYWGFGHKSWESSNGRNSFLTRGIPEDRERTAVKKSSELEKTKHWLCSFILMWLWLLLPKLPSPFIFPWSVCFLKLSTIKNRDITNFHWILWSNNGHFLTFKLLVLKQQSLHHLHLAFYANISPLTTFIALFPSSVFSWLSL